MNAHALCLQLKAQDVDWVSSLIWEQPGVLGIQERPIGEGDMFTVGAEFEILEFGSEAAKKCADYLDSEKFRGSDDLILEVFINLPENFSAEAFVLHLQEECPGGNIRLLSFKDLPPQDYLADYQKSVRGQSFGRALWVGPPWDSPPADRTAFFVEPGLAFGTGDHPTTQLCLERLEEMAICLGRLKLGSRELPSGPFFSAPPSKVLDLGTGSGVLAAACRRFFPQARLVATDLDPLCEAEFQKTFALNRMNYQDVDLRFGPQAELSKLIEEGLRFDLVVSNIYAEVLAALAPQVAQLLKPGALWILSGVLEGPSELILNQAIQREFLCQERRVRSKVHTQLTKAEGMKPLVENWVFLELRKQVL